MGLDSPGLSTNKWSTSSLCSLHDHLSDMVRGPEVARTALRDSPEEVHVQSGCQRR